MPDFAHCDENPDQKADFYKMSWTEYGGMVDKSSRNIAMGHFGMKETIHEGRFEQPYFCVTDCGQEKVLTQNKIVRSSA